MVEKLGNEPESWDLEKWFQDINLELDKLAPITVNEENKVATYIGVYKFIRA